MQSSVGVADTSWEDVTYSPTREEPFVAQLVTCARQHADCLEQQGQSYWNQGPADEGAARQRRRGRLVRYCHLLGQVSFG